MVLDDLKKDHPDAISVVCINVIFYLLLEMYPCICVIHDR